MRYREVRLEVQSLESLRNRLFRRLVPQLLVCLLGGSRPAADASREVTQRWLLDGLDVSVGHRRCSRDPPSQKDAGRTPGSKKQANPLKRRGRLVWFFMRFRGPDGPKGQLRSFAITHKIPYVTTFAQSKILLDASTVPRIAWVLDTFANIRRSCFGKENRRAR